MYQRLSSRLEHAKAISGVTPAALSALVSYDWPANVRELKNVLESAVLFATGSRIDLLDLPLAIRGKAAVVSEDAPAAASPTALPAPSGSLIGKTIGEIEREAILTALQVSGGNRRRAAEMLDIGLRTLQRKLKEYRGEPADGPDEEDEDADG